MTNKDIFEDAFPQDKQIGGSHYKDFHIQPYEFISKNDLSFFQGNVVKYVCRYLHKNGVEDLEKIKHYCDLEIKKLKDKYGLKTESEWDEALDEVGDEDIKKIKKLIKSGEDLNKNPRISISTIHGVKGNERENVVVITDLAGAAFIDYEKDPDDTHRLFYVACTRTEKNLYIIEPQTKKAYNL